MITHGEDWQVLDGLEEGVTQLSKRAPGTDTSFVWNFPINVAYRSTNIFGWPQLVLSVYDVDNLGRDIVLGYGSCHLPTAPGNYNLKIRLYKPKASSLLQHLTSWITRVQPEFVDPKFPTQTEGREVVRAQSSGHAIATVNVMTRVSGDETTIAFCFVFCLFETKRNEMKRREERACQLASHSSSYFTSTYTHSLTH